MIQPLVNLLQSPANWAGLALATLGLLAPAWDWAPGGGWLLAPLGYALGFVGVGLWLGWPKWRVQPWEQGLAPARDTDEPQALAHALEGLRQLVARNPDERLPASLQARLLELCEQTRALLTQWERSRASLPLEEQFVVRHIVQRYLPDALRAYLAIPAPFARDRLLANGRTAEDTLRLTVDDLSAKVRQLTDDLTTQDAEAFLNHARFLEAKFRPPANPLKDQP